MFPEPRANLQDGRVFEFEEFDQLQNGQTYIIEARGCGHAVLQGRSGHVSTLGTRRLIWRTEVDIPLIFIPLSLGV